VELIRNVGRSCNRFVILDLVRHPLPLLLFPLLCCPIRALDQRDGWSLINPAFFHAEGTRVPRQSCFASSAGTFRQSVGWFYTRQIVDISYR
jgi:hypothetical protein